MSSDKRTCYTLTHWGQVTHICVSKLTIIGSDNGVLPRLCQAIIWPNAVILLIQPMGKKFSEILIEIHIFSFRKMHLNMSSVKWRLFCLSLNVLNQAIATHLKFGKPSMKAWSWNELKKLDFAIGYQDRCLSNGYQVICLIWHDTF